MENFGLEESNRLAAADELQFACKMIQQGIDTGAAHRANRAILWRKGLPFYTILSDKDNINLKEFPDGVRQLVSRHIKEDGTITDILIEELTS